MSENQRPQGLFLFSGGLDSLLASRLLKNQGVRIVGLRFRHSFLPPLDKAVREVFSSPLIEVDLRREFLQILRSPPNGFGKNANPCLDCKILFYTQARLWLEKTGCSYVVSGDVVEQRPFSQRRQALAQIEKASGLRGLVVRPLCQRLLPPSLPETRGWVDRERLEALSGRGRHRQFELAALWNISALPTPAGGCSLTQVGFGKKVLDLLSKGLESLENFEALKRGSYFSLGPKTVLIMGRDEGQNEKLRLLFNPASHLFFEEPDLPTPCGLLLGEPVPPDRVAALLLGFSKCSSGNFLVQGRGGEARIPISSPIDRAESERFRI